MEREKYEKAKKAFIRKKKWKKIGVIIIFSAFLVTTLAQQYIDWGV